MKNNPQIKFTSPSNKLPTKMFDPIPEELHDNDNFKFDTDHKNVDESGLKIKID